MHDAYPLRPDADWYAGMIGCFGKAVPRIENLQVRRGLQIFVADLIDQIVLADRRKVCRLASMTTRNAGFVIIDVAFLDEAEEADRRLIGMVVRRWQEVLSSRCEHCGSAFNLSIHRCADQSGDRLLCADCIDCVEELSA